MRTKIIWHNEYSHTDEPDKLGRWARSGYSGNKKMFVKGKLSYFPVAWIGQLNGEWGRKYSVTYHFGQIGGGSGVFNTLEEAKKSAENQFNWFLKCVRPKFLGIF
jgi:hypothetical protein